MYRYSCLKLHSKVIDKLLITFFLRLIHKHITIIQCGKSHIIFKTP